MLNFTKTIKYYGKKEKKAATYKKARPTAKVPSGGLL